MKQVTGYPEISDFLAYFSAGIQIIFGNQLVGIYLFGSLSYGDFDLGRSDIDLLVILKTPVDSQEYSEIEKLHKDLGVKYPAWAARHECSYTPVSMFESIVPPVDPRPYYGEQELYQATYGNEWIINNYLLQEHGVALYGPEFKTLIKPISINEVQAACVKDLEKEWIPKLNDDVWLSDPHYQSYLVLNLCRILHTVLNSKVSSKKVSAEWVKSKFPQWQELIETAESWHYGQAMNHAADTKSFLQFTIDRIHNNSNLLQ